MSNFTSYLKSSISCGARIPDDHEMPQAQYSKQYVCKWKSLLAEMNVKTETLKTLIKFCKLGWRYTIWRLQHTSLHSSLECSCHFEI